MGDEPHVHRPRTVRPGRSGAGTVIRPRTIGPLGRPDPIPPPDIDLTDDATSPAGVRPVQAEHLTGAEPAIEPVPSIGEIEALTGPGTGPVTAPVQIVDPTLWDEPESVWEEADSSGPPDRPDGRPSDESLDRPAGPALGTVEPARLLRNNVLVAGGTMLSRLTGLVRTALVASVLYKSLSDTYILANNTPNQIYELILGGILTATLVPLFTDDLEKGDGEGTSAVVSFTVVVLVALTVVTAVLSPLLMRVYATGSSHDLEGDFKTVGIRLAILFAPQVFFYGLMALWSALLNARHRFFAAAWAPVLNNLLVIGVLVAARIRAGRSPRLSDVLNDDALLLLLGIGTSAGIALMALSLYPALRRSGMRLHFRFRPRHPAVKRVLRLSFWTFGYVVANQVAVVIVYTLSKPGSGGARDYALSYQVFQLPHSLFAVSIMVTIEPLLGRAMARADRRTFNDQFLLGSRLIGMLVIPAAIGYVALPFGLRHGIHPTSGPIHDILRYGGIVAAFAVGLPGFSSYLYTFRAFYAMTDTKTPFVINLFENAVNVAAAFAFSRWWGVTGLALSFSLAYTLAALVALLVLRRRSPGFDLGGLVSTWLKLLLAGVVMGGFVFGVTALVAPTTNVLFAATTAVAILLGAVTYFGAVYALDVPGVGELMSRLPVGRRSTGSSAPSA